jgi:hypothetical protein
VYTEHGSKIGFERRENSRSSGVASHLHISNIGRLATPELRGFGAAQIQFLNHVRYIYMRISMRFLKSLFFNSLIVFFANYILPGIQVVNQTKLPHLGGDVPFAVALGFLNALIFPILRLISKDCSIMRIAPIALILNFAAYGFLKFASFVGIQIISVGGYVLASLVVAIGSFWINFIEMKHVHPRHHEQHKSEPQ